MYIIIWENISKVPYPAANLYEAMYGYALSINLTLANGSDTNDGEAVAKRLWNNKYTGKESLNKKLTLSKCFRKKKKKKKKNRGCLSSEPGPCPSFG